MFKVSRISQAVGSALAVVSLAGIVALAAAGIAVRDAGEPNVRSLGPGDDFATRHAPPELVLTWADDYATRRFTTVELGTNDDYGTRRSSTVELGTNDDYGIRLGGELRITPSGGGLVSDPAGGPRERAFRRVVRVDRQSSTIR